MSMLLVCSVGGHLAELQRLVPRLPAAYEQRTWVTFDTPQSRSALAGEQVHYVSYTGPRDIRNVLRHSLHAMRLLGGRPRFSSVVSTGSGIALSFLPPAHARGVSCHYIESFTRTSGPSLTGRLLSAMPGMSLYTQHPSWAGGRWHYGGCVLDEFQPLTDDRPARPIRRAVVTLGTMEDYPFPRLLEQALSILPKDVEVLWQTGCTDVSRLPVEGHRAIAGAKLREAISQADVVIGHAGCGSAVTAMEVGKMPLLVPRRVRFGENVDDHQMELAAELRRRGLAVVREIENLTLESVQSAARGRVLTLARPEPFALQA